MIHRSLPLIVCCAALAATPERAPAQEWTGRLDAETRTALVPGVAAEFQSRAAPATLVDSRIDRLPALVVTPQPSLLSAAGPQRVAWRGYLRMRLRETVAFSFAGSGQATLTVNGAVVLSQGPGRFDPRSTAQVELVKGYNLLEVTYLTPAAGAESAEFRLLWSSDYFALEPVPPTLLVCDPRDPQLAAGRAIRHGRELWTEHRCGRCHQPEDAPHTLADADNAPPGRSLAPAAPELTGLGSRVNAAWLRAWLLAPTHLRNDVRMPQLLVGEAAARQASDLAAYLLSSPQDAGAELLAPPSTGDAAAEAALAKAGARHYELLGCIACHRFTPPDEEDDHERISLHFVAAKYRPGALAAFLQAPDKHWPTVRMGDFHLSSTEARELEAHLRQRSLGQCDEAPLAGDAERGARWFAELQCSACHNLTPAGAARPVARPPVRRLAGDRSDAGCLSPPADASPAAAPATHPQFALTDASRHSIRQFLAADARAWRTEPLAEFSARQFERLRCFACHERDEREPLLPLLQADEGELGRAPEAIPPLTWVGDKLYPAWSEKLLTGGLPYRLRDYLVVRMPAFRAVGAELAHGLSHEHGWRSVEPPVAGPVDRAAASLGERLAAMDTGLACNRCHAIGKTPPQAPEQAHSTDLSLVWPRVRYDYYRRWMLDPARVDPRTRMLKFAPDGRRTPLVQILDGDAERQFDALWSYLHRLHVERP